MDRIAVVGVGNIARGDDGIGIVAARRIHAELPRVSLIESSGDITQLLECFRKFEAVHIVDAIHGGEACGGIHRFDAMSGPLPGRELMTSSHAMGVSQAIELARLLGGLPARLWVWGVQGYDFRMQEGLSRRATQALAELTTRIVNEIGKSVHPVVFRNLFG